VSLFETGYLATGAGLFESFPGELSQDGMAQRVADALRRGALTHGLGDEPDVDFLAMDWFAIADQPVEEVRSALNVTPRSDTARAAGSVGPWEPGGISGYRHASVASVAARAGRQYDPYGASL